MEREFVLTLIKFMETLGMQTKVEIARPSRHNLVCIEVSVHYKTKVEYLQYHCYKKRSRTMVQYDEGNTVIPVQDGILSFLNENKKVSQYFENLARSKATRFFEENE